MKISAPSPRGLAVCVAAIVAVFLLVQSTPPAQVNQGKDAALSSAVGAWKQEGGRVVLGATRYCDSFDPARSFDLWCGVVFRMYARNLMSFQGQPGTASLQVAPDVALSPPQVSADKTVWTFSLRPDVTWDDGSRLTSRDIKYSIERLFDSKIIGTVNINYLCLLSTCINGVPRYKGPYMRGQKPLPSIRTKGNSISFQLTSPLVDFDRVLALPQFSIVEHSRDISLVKRKKTYGDNPASAGPFLLQRNPKTKSVTFIRNHAWRQNADPIRNPHVSQMSWKVYPSDVALDRAVIDGAVDVRLGDSLGSEGMNSLEKNPSLLSNTDTPYNGYVNYFAILDQNIPLNRFACRSAIFYGIDKSALRSLHGGTSLSTIATSMLPPTIDGYDSDNNMYSSGDAATGDLSAAHNALNKCGYPDGFEMTLGYLNTGIGSAIARSVQTSLARIGIVVIPKAFDMFEQYTAVVQSPQKLSTSGISMLISGGSSQINSAYDFWSPIVDGRLISAVNNQNIAQINDATINSKLDQLVNQPENRSSLSAEINSDVMETAQYLPYAIDKQILYRSHRLANVYVQQGLGGHYDLVNLAIRS